MLTICLCTLAKTHSLRGQHKTNTLHVVCPHGPVMSEYDCVSNFSVIYRGLRMEQSGELTFVYLKYWG